MPQRHKSVIGIELGKFVVKMVEYSIAEKHVTTIAKLFIEPEEWDNETELTEKLSNWVLDKKQSKKPEIVTAVPAEFAVIKPLSMSPDEFKPEEAITWELSKYLGSSLSDYAYDFHPLSKDSTTSRFLAVAFRKTQLERYKGVLQVHGLPLTVVDIDILATCNAWEANYPEEANKSVLLIKADLNGVCLIFILKGQISNHFFISVPESYIFAEKLERSKLIHILMESIKKSLTHGSTKNDLSGSFEKCVFCGDLATDAEFTESLRSAVQVETTVLNAFKEIKFPHDPEFSDKVRETAPQCATALGLALRYKGDS